LVLKNSYVLFEFWLSGRYQSFAWCAFFVVV